MGQCEAWLNGKIVGTVNWDTTGYVSIRCMLLPEDWIYRAVLLSEDREIGRFGVLLPYKNYFSSSLRLPVQVLNGASLHCEVLRSKPGENIYKNDQLTMSQLFPWTESAFLIDPLIALQIKQRSEVFYRIYNKKKYLLAKMDLAKQDSFVTMYTAGKAVEIEKQWFLCLMLDNNGQIKPWPKDEK